MSAPAPAPAPAAKPARNDKSAQQSPSATAADCADLSGVINATGGALVQQLTALPRITCTYPLFELTGRTPARPSANPRW